MQKAVIHFQCDATRTGNDDAEKEDGDKERRADDDEAEDDGRDLQYVSYGPVETKDGIMQVLRLNWKTKYACEDYQGGDGDSSRSWGFFTWFILMSVLPTHLLDRSDADLEQCLPWNCGVSDLWILAQLQPIRRSRLGSSPSRRHHQRHPISSERLGPEGC